MSAADEQALLYLAGMALQAYVQTTDRVCTKEAGFMAAHLAVATLHYLRNPNSPPPEGVK